MCLYSAFWNKWEKKNLAPYSVSSDDVWYSMRCKSDTLSEPLDAHGSRSRYRTAFEIDKDRIAKSQAFRRLEYKTQVFVTHEGDNYRTRLTHSLEVSEVARHIARALRLNEHLVEAIALGHDLGHAPYGHTGEEAINEWISTYPDYRHTYYFSHNQQSVEVVESLEPGYDWDRREDELLGKGLNLTRAVKEGILRHTSFAYRGMIHQEEIFDNGKRDKQVIEASKRCLDMALFAPGSLEAQVVRISDDIAQRISDLEDGLRSNILKKDQIMNTVREAFKTIEDRIFHGALQDNLDRDRTHIVNKDQAENTSCARVPLLLLIEITDSLYGSAAGGGCLQKGYGESFDFEAVEKLSPREQHIKDAGLIAFLLHMWKDADVFSSLSAQEQGKHKNRIVKYLRMYLHIKNNEPDNLSSYNLIGFLRGLLLANVIEHSFWNLQYALNKDFSRYLNLDIMKDYSTIVEDSSKTYYLIFVVVDGFMTQDTGRRTIGFTEASPDEKLVLFRFDDKEGMDAFIEKWFEKILRENGANLPGIMATENGETITKVDWLNKSHLPEMTEYVFLGREGGDKIKARLENVKIYYTGYKELCPGCKDDEKCFFMNANNLLSREQCQIDCPFYTEKLQYPDVNRLIKYHEYAADIDGALARLISERIHNSPKVARMTRMGKQIVKYLLQEYLAEPKIMHQRVWLKIQSYPEISSIGSELRAWIDSPMRMKEKEIFPLQTLAKITRVNESSSQTDKNDKYCLIRLIISHIAGMTDRYIMNEYNRLTRGGGETETPDETYFFM